MKKTVCILLALALLLCGCGGPGDATEPKTEADHPEAVLFPVSDALVGDTMPFFEDGKMNIFFLADQRDGKLGYHPWGLLRTEDYWNYEDAGIVLPYGETAEDQDIALGTGCVMKDQQGKYHAFYTGHNDYRAPAEAVMHAVSDDMLHWTKLPEDTFTAAEPYSTQDFRDPYVFYVESEQRYWMLVVTRTADTGVIVKYSSTDLHSWQDEGVFFEDDMGYATNMECPSLLQFGGQVVSGLLRPVAGSGGALPDRGLRQRPLHQAGAGHRGQQRLLRRPPGDRRRAALPGGLERHQDRP